MGVLTSLLPKVKFMNKAFRFASKYNKVNNNKIYFKFKKNEMNF